MNIYLLLLFICMQTVNCKIEVLDAGVDSATPGNVAMKFYVKVKNGCDVPIHMSVSTVKCCETINSKRDCTAMNLIGGYMGILEPKNKMELTLLLPNLYLYNRIGKCTIAIHCKSKRFNKEIQRDISFNTSTNNNSAYRKCQSADLDPLDRCLPVDCNIKYWGSRNYFSRKLNSCQKVPSCITSSEADIPSVALQPLSNRCIKPQTSVRFSELKHLEKRRAIHRKPHREDIDSEFINLRCNNGHFDKETSFCKCDDGWLTEESEKEKYEPNLILFHACSTEDIKWNEVNKFRIQNTIVVFGITTVIIIIVILLLTIALHVIHTCLKEKQKPFKRKRSQDNVDLESVTDAEFNDRYESD